MSTLTNRAAARLPEHDLVASYTEELEARRQQLCEDHGFYRTKLADLAKLDPLDFTGLAKLYRAHVSHIEALLAEF
jgi:hypothetical protein